jgi:hypothetical protein
MKSPCLRSGFVLVVALVFLTLFFAAASGLYLSREMWAFRATKQVDVSLAEMQARADASAWLVQVRSEVQSAPLDDGALSFALPEASARSQCSFGTLDEGSSPYGFLAVSPYPELPPEADVVSVPLWFDLDQASYEVRQLPLDPYYSVFGSLGYVGALFRRELNESGRALRQGRFAAETTSVRAWASVDGALPAQLVWRVVPVSVFTLFVGSAPQGDLSAVGLGTWLQTSSSPYSSAGYEVASCGVGRIYVEGPAVALAPISLSLPLVATGGIFADPPSGGASGGSYFLSFPDHLGGGYFSASPYTAAVFRQARLSLYRGLLVGPDDGPARLLRPGMELGADGVWRPLGLAFSGGLIDHYHDVASVVVTADTDTQTLSLAYDAAQFDGGVQAQVDAFLQLVADGGAWSWDVAEELLFEPPLLFFDQFTKIPFTIAVEFVGGDADTYVLRVDLPSVDALTDDPASRKLTLACGNTVRLSGGFNGAGSSLAVMLVSPRVHVDTADPEVTIRGVVLTEAPSVSNPFYIPVGATNIPTVNLVGSLVLWRRLDSSVPSGECPFNLAPAVDLLTGSVVPPSVPAMTDVRLGARGYRLYRILPHELDEDS